MGAATTQHDGLVISRVTAEPKLRHSRSSRRTQTSSFRAQSRNPSPAYQRINQKIQRPLRSNMGAATTQHDGLVIPGVTAEPKLRHSRSSRRTQTSSFRAQSRNPSPAYQRINQKIQRPLRSNMGAATTQHDGLVISGVTAEPKLRHSAHSRGIHLPPTNASTRKSSGLCAQTWVLRLRSMTVRALTPHPSPSLGTSVA